MPNLRFEKEVNSLIVKNVRVINYTTEEVDFRKYQLMAGPDNDALVAAWCKPPFVLTELETTPIPLVVNPLTMDLYLMHQGLLTKLYKPCKNGKDPNGYTIETYTCLSYPVENPGDPVVPEEKESWEFFFHVDPLFLDVTPGLGPSQGGTTMSVIGRNFVTWRFEDPLLLLLTADIELNVDLLEVTATTFTFETPPQLLNSTDIYSSTQIMISFNRQRFYTVPYQYRQHDPSRVHWGDAISLSHLHADHFVLGAGDTIVSRATENHIVTAQLEQAEDTNKFFIITEPMPIVPIGIPTSSHHSHHLLAEANFQLTGQVLKPKTPGWPVLCNSTIRLLHTRTGKYLSTYFNTMPDSVEQEVHLNGHRNVGDTDDNWIVQCEHNTRHGYSWTWDYIANENSRFFKYNVPFQKYRIQYMLDNNNIYWRPSTVIRLFHPNSGKYLTFNDVDISAKVCRQCFKNKYKEITATDFVTRGSQQRFFVKRQTRMVIECSTTKELLTTRWRTTNSMIRVGDFVVWRYGSANPCNVRGPIPIQQNFQMETRFGQVLEVYTESAMVYVEEFREFADLYSKATRTYSSTTERKTHALSITSVHGPLLTQPVPAEAPASLNGRRTVKAFFDDKLDYMGNSYAL